MRDIDRPLVELCRPPIYTAMKYWGKKPHNIWGEYICNYTKRGGCVLDPFAGSSVAAFESVKAGRKAYSFDINPLSAFCIEALCSNFDEAVFLKTVREIVAGVRSDAVYERLYGVKCPRCGRQAWIQHCKWDKGQIYESGIVCDGCGERLLIEPTDNIRRMASEQDGLDIPYWYPSGAPGALSSITNSFIKNIGGNNFSNIWTRRNLYVLSAIFDKIRGIESVDLRLQLMYGFIQIVHLSSKMCVPRGEKSNRSFSTSWGRPAYMCANKQMEMNPLLLFERACTGKQSALSALRNVKTYIGRTPRICDVKNGPRVEDADIYYGTVSVLNLNQYVPDKSIDFIITDPPYGGLIQYLDLSYIWNVWLERIDTKYTTDFAAEITVKDGIKSLERYQADFAKSVAEISRVMKDGGKVVFTFNNKCMNVWHSFLQAIQSAGYNIENVIYQPNRRTGESNVSDGDGSSANDFYIRCSKRSDETGQNKMPQQDSEQFIVSQTVDIIEQRGEPTPINILFACLLAKVSLQGFNLRNFDSDFESIILKHTDKEFEVNTIQKQKIVWLKGRPIVDSQTLTHKLHCLTKTLAENNPQASADELREKIYMKYNNILIPSRKSIDRVIKKIEEYRNGIEIR